MCVPLCEGYQLNQPGRLDSPTYDAVCVEVFQSNHNLGCPVDGTVFQSMYPIIHLQAGGMWYMTAAQIKSMNHILAMLGLDVKGR